MIKYLPWLWMLALLQCVVSCSDDKTKETSKDAGSDASSEPDPDTNPTTKDSGIKPEPDAGQSIDSGPNPDENCVPGTLDCICGPGNTCEDPSVCVGTHCHLVAVWGAWTGADPKKEMLWWNDQGVWQ